MGEELGFSNAPGDCLAFKYYRDVRFRFGYWLLRAAPQDSKFLPALLCDLCREELISLCLIGLVKQQLLHFVMAIASCNLLPKQKSCCHKAAAASQLLQAAAAAYLHDQPKCWLTCTACCLQSFETRRPKEKQQLIQQALGAAVTDAARETIVRPVISCHVHRLHS